MNIKTKKFSLTPAQYYGILLCEYFRRRWLAFVIIFLLGFFEISKGVEQVFAFFIIFSILYTLYVLVLCGFYSLHILKGNKMVFQQKYYEIDHQFISCHWGDGSLNKIHFENIAHVVKSQNYYIFHISLKEFFYLPFNSFSSKEEREQLETLLKSKQLL